MRKIFKILISSLLCAALLLPLASCGGAKKTDPPTLESVRDELIMRIENSKDVNEIFWGEGLPVIPIGSELAEELGLYNEYNVTTTDDLGLWEYVDVQNTEYVTVEAIKIKAESAYAYSFLVSVYAAQFIGIYNSVGGTALLPHYYEDDFGIWKNANSEVEFPGVEKMRVFDYSTIKMDEAKSSGERIYITVDAHYEGESEVFSADLVFDKQNGGWYLAGPTY